MIGVFCCWSMLLPTIGVAGWVAPKSSSTLKPSTKQGSKPASRTTTATKSNTQTATKSKTSKNQLFYQSDSSCCDSSATKPFVPGFRSSAVSASEEQQREQQLSSAGSIPWIEQGDEDSERDYVFLSHWNWQLDYFRTHLTNLRVNVQENEDGSDDLYCMDDGSKRLYTISLSSDEYRDIRMTCMDFPSCKTLRCLAYPSDGKLPILGMGIMKFGKHQHLAVLDYQPLPDAAEQGVQEAYVSELLRMRDEIPSMGQPHTYKHFVTEERKYFTDVPLIGKWTDRKNDNENVNDNDTTPWLDDLERAQREFVRTHVRLTQSLRDTDESESSSQSDRVVQLHSDFDTDVSRKEPAGAMLVANYGPELAHRLVHEVIFPLSRNDEPEPAAEQR